MNLIDYGDAMVETKQVAPGTRLDHVFGFGLVSGSPYEDMDLARLMLARPATDECTGASERAGDA